MEYNGKQCTVETWDASEGKMKVSFDTSVVMAEFQAALKQQLAKRGLLVKESSEEALIQVRCRFIRINEGNRFLRHIHLSMFGFGNAVIEVDGELIVGGEKVADLEVTARKGNNFHFFGGSGKVLLIRCAKDCAKKISKKVISGLKRA